MGRLSLIVCAVLGTGCAQILGLDTTTGATPVTPDAPAGTVNLQVVRRSLGATIVDNPAVLTGLPMASWLVDDGAGGYTRVPATLLGTDTWEGAIPTGTPAVEFTMGSDYPDEYRRMIAIDQRNLKFLYAIDEHPNPQPIPMPAESFSLTMSFPNPYMAGDSFYAEVIGGWAYHPFFNGSEGASVPMTPVASFTLNETYTPYDGTSGAGFVPWSGRPLDAITMGDTMVGLHYRGSQLLDAGQFPAFAEPGAPSTLSVSMTALTTAALDVTVHPTTVATRLNATRPAGGGTAMSWSVVAAPGYQTANGIGPTLNSGSITTASPMAITAPYGNPFASRNWPAMFSWVSSNNRSVTITGGGTAYTATSGGLQDFAVVGAGLDLATPAPLPITISINGTALVTDNMTVALDLTKNVTLALDQDTNDPVTLYQFNVYNMVLDPMTNAWGAHPVYVAMTTAKSVAIPNDVFVAGKTYMIRGHCLVNGFPGLATGDFTQRQLPLSLGYLDGGIFTVTAQ